MSYYKNPQNLYRTKSTFTIESHPYQRTSPIYNKRFSEQYTKAEGRVGKVLSNVEIWPHKPLL